MRYFPWNQIPHWQNKRYFISQVGGKGLPCICFHIRHPFAASTLILSRIRIHTHLDVIAREKDTDSTATRFGFFLPLCANNEQLYENTLFNR